MTAGHRSAHLRIRGLAWAVAPAFRLTVDALDVSRARVTALLGASGSGKSSLLALLGRVEGRTLPEPGETSPTGSVRFEPEAGEAVELLGLDERALLRRALRGWRIGFVFQREGLFEGMDARGNLVWPLVAGGLAASEAHRRADRVLERVEVAPDREVEGLSGGERKRLALARALVLEPELLLLDEPFTGLDPRSLELLRGVLAEAAAEAGRTVVLVTHQPGDVESLADEVALMRAGRVVEAGPVAERREVLDRFLEGEGVPDGSPVGPGARTAEEAEEPLR